MILSQNDEDGLQLHVLPLLLPDTRNYFWADLAPHTWWFEVVSMKEPLNSAMGQKGMGTAIRSYGEIGGHCYQNNAGGRSPSSSQSTIV